MEQLAVIEKLKSGVNVIVDACAGSGKSTTILSAAIAMSDSNFLQLTYNSMLRHEIKEKIEKQAIKNLKVHTFHSLAKCYYVSSDKTTDTDIRRIIREKQTPRIAIPMFDIVVLDECQDMTPLYFQFIRKLTTDMASPFSLLVLGDYMQCLYEFKGADIRFLTMADRIWLNLKSHVFERCSLKTSYRITNQMSNFINEVMLKAPRIAACRDGEPVVYIRNSRANLERFVVAIITRLLAEGDKPEDIFILGASVKGAKSNIRKMENALVERGIPCYVPMFEDTKIDDRVIAGKIVFSTFHTVKGRQRKYVFLMGFDNTYFDYYARNMNPDVCPNTLYVGCTRATHGLYLLENDQYSTDQPLHFLQLTHHEMKQKSYISFKGTPRSIFYQKKTDSTTQKHFVTPTDLIKFIPEPVLEEITPILDRIFIQIAPEQTAIDIPSVILTKSGYEEISDLTGIAIPSMYYDYIGGTRNILYNMIQTFMNEIGANDHAFLKTHMQTMPKECSSPRDYLVLANMFVSVQEKLYFKLKQIDPSEYTWITDDIISLTKARLDSIIGAECNDVPLMEETIICASDDAAHTQIDIALKALTTIYRFTARVDLVAESVWELKCTSEITTDHLLQVVIYAWIWRMTRTDSKEFKILNIKTGEIKQLTADLADLTTIVISLLKGKYDAKIPRTDAEFVADCLSV